MISISSEIWPNNTYHNKAVYYVINVVLDGAKGNVLVSGNSGRPRTRLALLSEGDNRFLLPEGDARFLSEATRLFNVSGKSNVLESDSAIVVEIHGTPEATCLFNVSGKSNVLESGSAVVVEIRGTPEVTCLFNVSGKSNVLESGSAVVVEIRGTLVLIS